MKIDKKNLTKELVILVVLLILILLIMAVALYDFIPSNVDMPESITYTADRATTSVKQEIAYTNGGDATADESESELVTSLKSYSIQASDLTVYGQKNLYNSGNSNPFDYAEEVTPADTTENAQANGSATTNGTSNTNNSQNSSNASVQNTATGATTNNSTTGTFFESSSSK